MAYLARSLRNLLAEVDKRWPGRDHWSDGWLGDDSHATRFSDHNPDNKGCVHAFDFDATLTHTMGSGPVGDQIAAIILEQCRSGRLRNVVNYVIYKRRIYSRAYGYRARYYTGTNPHDSHVHVSILRTSYAESWPNSWRIGSRPKVDLSNVREAMKTLKTPVKHRNGMKRIEDALHKEGLLEAFRVNGRASSETRDAYQRWQRRLGLRGDDANGIPGWWSLRKLGNKYGWDVVR